MSRDFTYVADIVDGIIKVIDNPAKTLMHKIQIQIYQAHLIEYITHQFNC